MKLTIQDRQTIFEETKSGKTFQKEDVEMLILPNKMYGVRKTNWPADIVISYASWINAIAAFELLLGEGRDCNG